MSNPKGINRHTGCDLCGAINRKNPCEDIRCGWRELPPRSKSRGEEPGRAEQASPVAA